MKFENKVIPSEEQLNGFLENPDLGPISMVNLLKYKNKASYEDGRNTNLTGEEAYGLYAIEVINLVEKYGGEFIFAGKVNRRAMFEMTMDPEYQKIHIHRDAGLAGQLNIETI